MFLRHTRWLCAVPIICGSLEGSSQWQLETGVPAVDFYGVEQFDGQTIHGAGAFSLLRTTNNGAVWDTTYVTVFGAQFACILYDVHFISSQVGVASGFMSLGSQYVMLRTTDAGQNWTAAYISNTGGLLRTINDIAFGSATEGFAVGTDNRLLRTLDGGQNWTQLNPPSGGHLYAFQYGSGNVRHIAGDGRILRSTDGGTNWTAQYFTGHNLRGLHFPSGTRGYAVGEDGSLLRTDDAGLSWTMMDSPFGGVDLTDVFFTSDDVGYVTGGTRIWRTTTGGMYWESFECGAEMNAITFYNGEGIAVGAGGTIYRTTGSTSGYIPTALFTVAPTVLCEDSLVTLTNLSDPALTSTWYYNGDQIANTTNASLVIDQPAQTDTITLVVNNGSENDTLSSLINIAASLNLDVNAALVQDTLCAGGSTQVQVPASLSDVSYRLRRGSNFIGSAQNGNGNTLTFNTGTINGDDILNILATRTVTGCGTGRDSTYLVIHSATPITGLTVTVEDPSICIGESTDITINGSQPGVSYQLKLGNTNVGSPQTGTGGTIVLNSGPLNGSVVFTILATHPFGCTATLGTTANVNVEIPEAHFTLDSWNPEAGSSVDTYNTSDPAIAYAWNFGPGATPQTSNAIAPSGVVFNETGLVNVSLTVTSPSGCTNTTTLPIHVIPVQVPGTCDAAQGYHLAGSGGYVAAINHGNNGDVFMVVNNASSEDLRFYSGAGDTLIDQPDNGVSFEDPTDSYHLVKFNASGVGQWLVRLWHGSVWAEAGDVAVDDAGNIYMVFYHGDYNDSLSIYGTDGRVVSFMPPWDGSTFNSAVVVSWDSHGLYRWHNTFLEPYWLNHLRILLDGNGAVYASGQQKLVKFNALTGAEQWTRTFDAAAEFADVAMHPDGSLWLVRVWDLRLDHVAADGSLIAQENLAELIDVPGYDASYVITDAIVSDADGALYMSGDFKGRCVIGNDTLEDLEPPFANYTDRYLLRYDPGSGIAWIREMEAQTDNGYYDHGGLCVGDGHVNVLTIGGDITFGLAGHPPLTLGDVAHVLTHFDISGGTPRMSVFPSVDAGYSTYFGGMSPWSNALVHDPATGRMAATVDFSNAFDFGGTTIQPHVQQYAGNVFLGLGEEECFIPLLPSPTAVPVSWFTNELPACVGQPVQFTDASLNDASDWSWTFAGGTPATSSLATPSVTFSTPGAHVVTLTASNGNGTGAVYSETIVVDVCAGIGTATGEALSVRPGVADDHIVITASASAGSGYRIMDMGGRTVHTGVLAASTELDVRAFANGTYTLSLMNGTGTMPCRFVVLH